MKCPFADKRLTVRLHAQIIPSAFSHARSMQVG
jgi:hypothetical protein